jgi:DNA-binding transcriptional ArsR family regulator
VLAAPELARSLPTTHYPLPDSVRLTIEYIRYTIDYQRYTEGSMLAQLLGSDARVRVLSLVLTHPDEAFYGREIGRRTGLLPRAVQRELDRLTRLGLLHREQRGNRVYVRANRKHPIFPELRSIILKTVALGDVIRGRLSGRADLAVAFIYGSTASNEDTAESDIDLFLIGRTSMRRISPLLSELEAQLAREINASTFTPEEFAQRAAAGDPFLSSVVSSPKIFLIGSRETLEELLP